MITLHRPEKTEEQLKAIAGSGASGLSTQAQAQLRQRKIDQLRKELGR